MVTVESAPEPQDAAGVAAGVALAQSAQTAEEAAEAAQVAEEASERAAAAEAAVVAVAGDRANLVTREELDRYVLELDQLRQATEATAAVVVADHTAAAEEAEAPVIEEKPKGEKKEKMTPPSMEGREKKSFWEKWDSGKTKR